MADADDRVVEIAEDDDELIDRYLCGDLTPAERKAVDDRLAADPALSAVARSRSRRQLKRVRGQKAWGVDAARRLRASPKWKRGFRRFGADVARAMILVTIVGIGYVLIWVEKPLWHEESVELRRLSSTANPSFPNGRDAVTEDDSGLLRLPDGASIQLRPYSRFVFNRDSARLMEGVLTGDAILTVPRGRSWRIRTRGGTFSSGMGQNVYGIQAGRTGEEGTRLAIARGTVHAGTDSVAGTGVFAVVTGRPAGVRQVQDTVGFPPMPGATSWNVPGTGKPIDPAADRMRARTDGAARRAAERNAAAESVVAARKEVQMASAPASARERAESVSTSPPVADTGTSVRAEEPTRPTPDSGAARGPLGALPGESPLLVVKVPWTSTSKVQRVGDVPPLIKNGYRLETGRNEIVRIRLPDGATLILYPESRFTWGGDSARVMKAIFGGEAVLEVPRRTWWQMQTTGGGFNLGTGRYAVRSWKREDRTAISIERGRVYAFGDSVVGTGVFAVVNDSLRTVRRVEDGTGFPVIPPEDEP